MELNEAKQILERNGYLVESHLQGHCDRCGIEIYSDEAYYRHNGKTYCADCYDEVVKPNGKFKFAEIYFIDLDTKQNNNVLIDIKSCPAKTEKAAKEYALKIFDDKIYDGFYDEVNVLMHTRHKNYRNIKIKKVEVF